MTGSRRGAPDRAPGRVNDRPLPGCGKRPARACPPDGICVPFWSHDTAFFVTFGSVSSQFGIALFQFDANRRPRQLHPQKQLRRLRWQYQKPRYVDNGGLWPRRWGGQ